VVGRPAWQSSVSSLMLQDVTAVAALVLRVRRFRLYT